MINLNILKERNIWEMIVDFPIVLIGILLYNGMGTFPKVPPFNSLI